MVATRDGTALTSDDNGEAVPAARRRTWYDRVEFWAGIAVAAICCGYVLAQLRPGLLVLDTTATGGDTGAHVWWPEFLRDHLLPWRLTGWAPDYYAGFPGGQFYFPFPALLVVALDVVLPYNVAFKLVTASGAVALPAAAYLFGRGVRAPRPAPALFAVGATAFLFFKDGGDSIMRFDHHIMGGTLTSTLAGEFSFTIALALALCFLGSLARALEVTDPPKRVNLWLPALLLAAVATSHLVVAVFAAYGALVIWLVRRPLRSWARGLSIVVVGVLLTSVWLLPLASALKYTTDMRYEPVGTGYTDPWLLNHLGIRLPAWFDWLFISEMWFLFPLGLIAIGAGIAYRRRAALDLAGMLVAAGLVFCGWELLRDVFGKAPAWNLRLLPFWYLLLYLLAALGAAELARWAGSLAAWVVYGPEPAPVGAARAVRGTDSPDDAGDGSDAVARDGDDDTLDGDDDTLDGDANERDGREQLARAERPPTHVRVDASARGAVRVITMVVVLAVFTTIALVRVHATRGYQTYWAAYNYTGYEGGLPEDFTQKAWPEYRSFMDTAKALPPGRMLWEPTNDIGKYGTPLALMLLPYWTDGRIDSMEGLYYEAAGSTDYHFLAAATLTPSPSNPVRGLPYRTFNDFDLGVRYLQELGVRYYAATSADAKAKAAANPALHEVAQVPDLDDLPPSGWTIYEVDDAATVTPLAYEPVVATGLRETPNWKCNGVPRPTDGYGVAELGAWECLGVPWFNDPEALDRPLTADGPSDWAREPMLEARNAPKRELPTVTVSNIRTRDERIEFDVSRTGVPVLVKTSYYPNWQAEGAEGPYRATPNFMVVVPTDRHVVLTYGTTTLEWVGRVLTLVGVAGVGMLVWWGGVRRRRPDEPVPASESASPAG